MLCLQRTEALSVGLAVRPSAWGEKAGAKRPTLKDAGWDAAHLAFASLCLASPGSALPSPALPQLSASRGQGGGVSHRRRTLEIELLQY